MYQELFVSRNFSLAPENEDIVKTLMILTSKSPTLGVFKLAMYKYIDDLCHIDYNRL